MSPLGDWLRPDSRAGRIRGGVAPGAASDSATVAADEAREALERKIAELTTVNEISVALASTFDLDDLIDRSLRAVIRRLQFESALILLHDPERGVLGHARCTGGGFEECRPVSGLEVRIEDSTSPLAETFESDGPLLFTELDRADDEPARRLARVLGTGSVLATPLVSNGRPLGVMVVGIAAGAPPIGPGDGPLLFTVGSLVAGAVESSRLYREIQAYSRELEGRVAERTRDLATAVEEAQASRAAAETAREAAETANATKTTFLNNVSHELRTPLTSVVGFSRIISKRLDEVVFPTIESDDPKVRRAMRQVGENLAIIVEEGERLTAMINDILDLAKIEAGRMEWRRVPVHPGELLERGLAATSSLFTSSGLELVTEVEPGLPVLEGDRDRLLQVVINLVSNAVKFTPPGGRITCRARLVAGTDTSGAGASDSAGAGASDSAGAGASDSAGAGASDSAGAGATGAGPQPGSLPDSPPAVVISVQDTGVGIAPEDHAKVFEQFGQAGQNGDTLTDKPRGTGLGLPICREIVEHHGGRLWLESAVGAGSTFSFSLPVVAVP